MWFSSVICFPTIVLTNRFKGSGFNLLNFGYRAFSPPTNLFHFTMKIFYGQGEWSKSGDFLIMKQEFFVF